VSSRGIAPGMPIIEPCERKRSFLASGSAASKLFVAVVRRLIISGVRTSCNGQRAGERLKECSTSNH
jgi:hypothetical protein